MTMRIVPLVLTIAALTGCARTPQPPAAPATFAVHADGVATLRSAAAAGVAGDLGFETTDCCGAGLYVAAAQIGEAPEDSQIDQVLEGGIEMTAVVPPICSHLANRLRVRVRAGKAGTPPNDGDFGRSGYAGGIAILYRAWHPDTPEVGKGSSNLDLLVGASAWSFRRERTAAGPQKDPESFGALLIGLRLGLDYGVDLE